MAIRIVHDDFGAVDSVVENGGKVLRYLVMSLVCIELSEGLQSQIFIIIDGHEVFSYIPLEISYESLLKSLFIL